MKTSTLFILTYLLLSFSCSTFSNHKVEKLYLFKAEKDSKTIYLFGTIHFGITANDLPPSFWPYFNSADSYAFEKVANTPADTLNTRNWILSKLNKPAGAPEIRTLLNESEYKKLDLYFGKLNKKDNYFSNKSVFWVTQNVYLKSLSNSKSTNLDWATLDNQLLKKVLSIR